jgi:hypothetical protein
MHQFGELDSILVALMSAVGEVALPELTRSRIETLGKQRGHASESGVRDRATGRVSNVCASGQEHG